MQIHTELDDQHYLKLQQLQNLLDKDINQLLSAAIDHLYNQHNVAVGSEALAILNKNGFVGCFKDDPDLSQPIIITMAIVVRRRESRGGESPRPGWVFLLQSVNRAKRPTR